MPLPLPPQPWPQQATFLCSRNVGELSYSQRMVQGVTATLQEGNLSLHFKCEPSLHCRLLSWLFLFFNNLIISPVLIFLPQMSLQRFMPMNIHPLFKDRVPFPQGRCISAAGLEVSANSLGDSERNKAPALSQGERGLQPPVPRTSPSSPHSPQLCRRQKSLGCSAAAEHCDRCGGGPVGRQEVPARHVHRSPLGLVASCWAQYLDSLLWPNVPITFTLLMADTMGTWLWNSRLPGRRWHWASGLEFPCLLSPVVFVFLTNGCP